MKTIEEYFAELEQDPHYAYSKAVGDASVDLLLAEYGPEAVVENLKEAEDAHGVHVAYYNDVVRPEIERGSTSSTRIFSSDSFGVTSEPDESRVHNLQELVVVDNIFLARVASKLQGIAHSAEKVTELADMLDSVVESVELSLIQEFGDERYTELYLKALEKSQ